MVHKTAVDKIISGGQTGADQGGIHAAAILNIPTGGTAPPNYVTETGPNYDLKKYGLVEGPPDPSKYKIRTLRNILDSDGTLIVGLTDSPGSRLTLNLCISNNKPYLVNPDTHTLRDWVNKYSIHTLNVAGNRESKNPGIHDRTVRLIVIALG